MTPLACSECGEPVTVALMTTGAGYSHIGASDHDVVLVDADTVRPLPESPIRDVDLILRGQQAATNSGLPKGAA